MTAPYSSSRFAYEGTETTETTIVRTGGAEDPAGQAQSRKIVTTANAQWLRPFRCEPWAIWNETTGADVTVTVYGMINDGVLPLSDEIWMDAEYLGDASSTLGKIVTTTKANVLATGVSLPGEVLSWTNTGSATMDGVSQNVTLSNGNRTVTHSVAATAGARSTWNLSGGKYYFEISFDPPSGLSSSIGVGIALSTGIYNDGYGQNNIVVIVNNTTCLIGASDGSSYSLGGALINDVFGAAVDMTSRKVWFRRIRAGVSGLWNGNASANPLTGVNGVTISAGVWAPYLKYGSSSPVGDKMTFNFGQTTFADVPPTGFGNWDGWLAFSLTALLNSPQPGRPGLIHVRPKIGKPSATVYLDPKIELTSLAPSLSISGTPVTAGIESEHGVSSSYAGFTVTASGGTAPYTYSLVGGTLPAGITLNASTGAVSGTPAFESAGTYSGIVIRGTDSLGAYANLAAFTITIAFKDPYWTSNKLLLDYDAADGNAVFTDQKSGVNMTVNGNAQHDTGVAPLYGTSSMLFDGTGDGVAFSDFFGLPSGTTPFTIDFTVRPTSVTGTQFWVGQWIGAGTLGWVLFQSGDAVAFNLSTDGTNNFAHLTTAAGALVINTWSRWRFDFDGTKYRLYKNGVMVASSTTVRSIYDVSVPLMVGINSDATSFGYIGNCRGVRITTTAARTGSDSGYTISNRAFPTSGPTLLREEIEALDVVAPMVAVDMLSGHKSSRYAYEGTETTETSIVRSGGTAHSRKIVTTANSQWLRPYRAEPYAVWNDSVGEDVTVTVYGNAATLPLNDEVWAEVEYLNTTHGTIVTTTKANVLATGVSVASDASSWAGGTTAFKLVATLDGGGSSPATGDPYWANVKLLLGFNGADAATGAPGMSDESSSARGVATVFGSAQIDTAQSVFGGSSLMLTGTGNYIYFPDSDDFYLASNPFTIEVRIRPTSISNGPAFIVCQWGSSNGWVLYQHDAALKFHVSNSSLNDVAIIDVAATLTVNTWHAICVDFDGTKYRMYKDGVMIGSSTTVTFSFNSTHPLTIGVIGNTTNYPFLGWMDEMRITAGVARYASDSGYTVATSEFPRSGSAAVPSPRPQPGQPGLINVRVKAAKPSATFYIDPTPVLEPASSLGSGGGGEPVPPDPDVYDPATGDEAPVMQIAVDVDALAASFAANAISAHGTNPAGTSFSTNNWTSPSASLKYATPTDVNNFLFAGTYYSRDHTLTGWCKNGEVLLRLVDGEAWSFRFNFEGAGGLTISLKEGVTQTTSPPGSSATATYQAYGTSTLNADIHAKIPAYDASDTEGHKFKCVAEGLDLVFSYSLDGSSFTEIKRLTPVDASTWLHMADGAAAIANITGYGWRDFTIDYDDNPSHLYSDFTTTLDMRDFGVKDVQTTGSMTSGSPTLIVDDATDLEIGDFVIVDTHGATGAGAPGGRGPGGQWPSLRYPNQTAMAADLTRPVDTACSLEDTGYVWHFDGAAWQRDATWNPDYSYMHKSHPMALRAKIIAKSGTILTLNANAQVTVGSSRVYHDNQPLLAFLADTQDFYVDVPEVELLFPNSRVVMGAALNIQGHAGWSLRGAGSGRANSTPTGRTRFYGPLGCPGPEINISPTFTSVKDIHIDSGGYFDLPQINAAAMAQTEYQVNWPHGLMFSLCSDITVDNVNVTQVFQQAVGFRYCHTATVSNCFLRMVDPLAHYIQWMYQTANSTNIRYIDCELDSDWMVTFCEPFADDGAEFIRCIARNGISSNNTATDTKYTDCGTILEALSRYSYNSQHVQNPVLQSNSNIGPGSPSTMTVDRFRYLLEGYVDVAKEQPKGIVLSSSAGSVVSNSNLEMLPYDLASSLNGAQGIICDSSDCTISAVRVDGTTVGDWAGNITAYDATANGTDLINCIADRQNNSQTGGTLTGAQTIAAAGTDRAPASVSFTPVVGATVGQTYTSNEITISGVNALLRNVTLTSNAKLIWLGNGVIPPVGAGTIRDHDHWVRKILRDGDKLKLQAVATAGTVTVTLQLATGQTYNWTITA